MRSNLLEDGAIVILRLETARDGQQARLVCTAELFDLLSRLSGPHGVIRRTDLFLCSHKARAAVEKCMECGRTDHD